MDTDKIEAFREKQAKQAELNRSDAKHGEVLQSLHDLLLATIVSKDPRLHDVAKNLGDFLQQIAQASKDFQGSSLHLLPLANKELAGAVQELSGKLDGLKPKDTGPLMVRLTDMMTKAMKTPPVVNVPKSEVKFDAKPLINALNEIKEAVKSNKLSLPKDGMKDVVDGLNKVDRTIGSLSFPVPNYVLPFTNGSKASQGLVDADGHVQVDIVSGGASVGSTATRSQVADSASDGQLLASSSTRLKAIIHNDSSALLYVGLGSTAVTSTNYSYRVYSNGTVEIDFRGEIRGIWASDPNDGGAKITEIS